MGISEIIKFMCDSIHTPIAICDIEYNIIYENKAAVERFITAENLSEKISKAVFQ